jgi:hypothetical protein
MRNRRAGDSMLSDWMLTTDGAARFVMTAEQVADWFLSLNEFWFDLPPQPNADPFGVYKRKSPCREALVAYLVASEIPPEDCGEGWVVRRYIDEAEKMFVRSE